MLHILYTLLLATINPQVKETHHHYHKVTFAPTLIDIYITISLLTRFVTTARTQALKCEFEDSELEERNIELMTAYTEIKLFQRELLGKSKGYELTDALAERRRVEAILVGRQGIQKRTSTPLNSV